MQDFGRDLCLIEKHGAKASIRPEFWKNHLESDRALKSVKSCRVGEPNLTHPAFRKLAHKLVPDKAIAPPKRNRW